MERKPPQNFCQVIFSDMAVKMINLLATLNSKNVKSSLATNKCNCLTPTVAYLTVPIHSKYLTLIALCKNLILISLLLVRPYDYVTMINLLLLINLMATL